MIHSYLPATGGSHFTNWSITTRPAAGFALRAVGLSFVAERKRGKIYIAIGRAGLTLTLFNGEAQYRDPNCRRY